ncbi:lytic transglycosylase domain-containing protein [Pseudoroseicyclus sp. CXY001]|uniref:lytic murein transglycosylase n=1 Tax=Pseudoroseicyclus sp. CXY001 TaxID=3242492 RepID=UPI00357131F1
MRILVPAALAALLALGACGPRPQSTGAAPPATSEYRAVPDAGFDAWRAGFEPRALAAGIPAPVVARAMGGAGYIPRVIEKDRSQAEHSLTYQEYFDLVLPPERIANGRAALRRESATLARLEGQYGVPAEVIAAVWGIESAYGTKRGTVPVISALATLAHDGRRGRFFEGELIAALRIIAAGEVSPERMLGSWAGAMGHTQFIPSSYLSLAVDGTGDGRRDIWGDDPADALASTANYLARSGWRAGEPVLLEVRAPAGLSGTRSAASWEAAGVSRANGGALGALPEGRLLRTDDGPAYLVFRNFDVIKRYNNADLYALAVGVLSQRIGG